MLTASAASKPKYPETSHKAKWSKTVTLTKSLHVFFRNNNIVKNAQKYEIKISSKPKLIKKTITNFT